MHRFYLSLCRQWSNEINHNVLSSCDGEITFMKQSHSFARDLQPWTIVAMEIINMFCNARMILSGLYYCTFVCQYCVVTLDQGYCDFIGQWNFPFFQAFLIWESTMHNDEHWSGYLEVFIVCSMLTFYDYVSIWGQQGCYLWQKIILGWWSNQAD